MRMKLPDINTFTTFIQHNPSISPLVRRVANSSEITSSYLCFEYRIKGEVVSLLDEAPNHDEVWRMWKCNPTHSQV
jgi:hypothetical protein